MGLTNRSSCFTVYQLFHCLKPQHCLLDAKKQRAGPADSPCHGRLVTGYGRGPFVVKEELINAINFSLKLMQDVAKLLHHSLINCIS